MTKVYETLSFALSVAGGLVAALSVVRHSKTLRQISGGLLFGVGIGGLTLTWDKWSKRCGHHLSVVAFAHPKRLDKIEVAGLCTHSGQLVVGAVLLAWL
ncbi:hypothetical protein LCGC14_1991350 [marine sediment metagenome]|uniref:Uncharacterized protein n=1 Tax=marine sediment metagenome TaxID=412755 RepID=A0A0F9F692_9ZZZZ